MLLKIGAMDARERFSNLLDRVGRGDRVVITRRGIPVAMMVAPSKSRRASIPGVIREIKALRAKTKKGPESLRSLRLQGRKY